MLHILCCAKLLLDPKSKMACLNVVSFLGRRASENFDFYPIISKKNCFITFLKPVKGGTYSVIFLLRLKMKRYSKNIYFDLVQIKNSFAHFRKLKSNIKQTKKCFKFISGYRPLMYEEGLCKFSNKNINF